MRSTATRMLLFSKMFTDTSSAWRDNWVWRSSRRPISTEIQLHPSHVYFVETSTIRRMTVDCLFQHASILSWWKYGATRISLSLFQVLSVVRCCYCDRLIYNKSSHKQQRKTWRNHFLGSRLMLRKIWSWLSKQLLFAIPYRYFDLIKKQYDLSHLSKISVRCRYTCCNCQCPTIFVPTQYCRTYCVFSGIHW